MSFCPRNASHYEPSYILIHSETSRENALEGTEHQSGTNSTATQWKICFAAPSRFSSGACLNPLYAVGGLETNEAADLVFPNSC